MRSPIPADRIRLDDLIRLRREAVSIDLGRPHVPAEAMPSAGFRSRRGRGMEFDDHRHYQPGDEARTIDWRVTARTGVAHVRTYREERERPVVLAVDLRPPMWFGTRGCFKAVAAARAAALCAWSAYARGDRVGGIVFGTAVRESRVKSGVRGVVELLGLLVGGPDTSAGPEDHLDVALAELARTVRPGSVVILISDFRGCEEPQRRSLKAVSRHAELMFCFVHDPLERELPPRGIYGVTNSLNQDTFRLNTSNEATRQRWQRRFADRSAMVRKLAEQTEARFLELRTENATTPLLRKALGCAR